MIDDHNGQDLFSLQRNLDIYGKRSIIIFLTLSSPLESKNGVLLHISGGMKRRFDQRIRKHNLPFGKCIRIIWMVWEIAFFFSRGHSSQSSTISYFEKKSTLESCWIFPHPMHLLASELNFLWICEKERFIWRRQTFDLHPSICIRYGHVHI